MRVATLFEGTELRASIFASTPARTNHRTRPNDSDEFVLVLSGKLILTEPNGTAHAFLPGDTLVMPNGYLGNAGRLPGTGGGHEKIRQGCCQDEFMQF